MLFLELLAQHDQLAEVIAGMVASQQDFPQQSLPVAPGNLRVQVRSGVAGKLFEFRKIFVDGLFAGLPRIFRRWSIFFWPIVLRPLWSDVFWICAEVKQIVQC